MENGGLWMKTRSDRVLYGAEAPGAGRFFIRAFFESALKILRKKREF